jgi:hypothetical protein
MYNNVQTGPKIQLGGEKKGFCRVAYQLEITGRVVKEPRNAIPKGSKRLNSKAIVFVIRRFMMIPPCSRMSSSYSYKLFRCLDKNPSRKKKKPSSLTVGWLISD